MRKFLHIISLVFVLTATIMSHAQDASFFTNLYNPAVTCYWGTPDNPYKNKGIKAYRHEVITEQGYDSHTNGGLLLIPAEEDSVVMLGGSRNSKKGQAIKYSFTIDSDSTILLLKYAVVFYSPGGNQPSASCARFMVKVTGFAEEIESHEVRADNLSVLNSAPSNIYWKNWTNVAIDLSPYIGKDVEVEFFTCDNNTKYGYAYYTASCVNSIFDIEDCGSPITINAPDGFESYLWNDGTAGQSNTITAGTNPVDVSCTMTSLSGNLLTLNATLTQSDDMLPDKLGIDTTVCVDQPFVHQYFNDTIIHTEAGDYVYTKTVINISSSNECSTTKVTLCLHVIDQLPDNHVYGSICHGEQYTDNGFNINTATFGIGINTVERYDDPSSGCSQKTILHLDVLPTYDSIALADEICFGNIYDGFGFHAEGFLVGDTILRKDTITSRGCDSIVYLHLHVNPTWDNTVIEDFICYGESYSDYGFEIENDSVGVNHHYQNFPTTPGCDSIVTLKLTVNEIYETILRDTICYGEDYHGNGFDTINPAYGICVMQNDLSSEKGCDSIVRMYLNVLKPDTVNLNAVMCETGVYNENDFYITCDSAGQYYDTLYTTSSLGCDSLVFLNLVVSTTYDIYLYDTIPYGDRYDIDSLDIHLTNPSPGTHPFLVTHTNEYDCVSTVFLELYVAYIYNIEIPDTICYGNSYYENGFTIENPEVGIIHDTLSYNTVYGFDSLVCLELLVAPVYGSLTFHDTICFEDEYHNHGFDYYNADDYVIGMNYDTLFLQSKYDCDSTVFLELFVAPTYDTAFSDTICIGEDYIQNGFTITNPEPGWHYDTLFNQSIFGCDNTLTLSLYVGNTFDTTFFDTICYGENYFGYGFEIENPEIGINYDTLDFHGTLSCDSTVNLELYVKHAYNITFQDTICEGEGYNNHGFELTDLGLGWHHETHAFQTALQCDSIIRLDLYVARTYKMPHTVEICHGEDYSGYGFNIINPGLGLNSDTMTYESAYGCDSVVILNLIVKQTFSEEIDTTVCAGDGFSLYEIQEEDLELGDNWFTQQFQTHDDGCDSTISIHIWFDNILENLGNIKGDTELLVETDLHTGIFPYSIDSIPGCTNYFWEISNNDWEITPNANKCELLVTTPDTATISVRASNSCSSIYQKLELSSRFFEVDETSSIDLNIYPNPCRDFINIEGSGIERVRVLTTTGTMLKDEIYEGADRVTLNLTGIANSLYLLEVTTSEGRCIRQITTIN